MKSFQIIDTFRVENFDIRRESLHFQRTKKAIFHFASEMKIELPEDAIDQLQGVYHKLRLSYERAYKVRVLIDLDPWKISFESEPFSIMATQAENSLLVAHQPVKLQFCRIGSQARGTADSIFKTNQRSYWDQNLEQLTAEEKRLGYDVLGVNSFGEVTECSRYSIFWLQDQNLITPPLSSGCLDGVLRRQLIEYAAKNGSLDAEFLRSVTNEYILLYLDNIRVIERTIKKEELKSNSILFVGNSVRGLLRANLEK